MVAMTTKGLFGFHIFGTLMLNNRTC